MKTESTIKWKVIKSSSPELLAELSNKLKGRELFPHQVEKAREFLRNAKFVDQATELRWRGQ